MRQGAEAQASTRPQQPASQSAPDIKPEVYLKEALTQLVRSSELPLGATVDGGMRVTSKVPEAVIDKAASIFLRAAGLTPDDATLDAARELVKQNVPVDRDTVQALMFAVADAPEDERQAMLHAAARLVAKDIPVAAPLVSGLADVLERRAGANELVQQTFDALEPSELPEQTRDLAQSARDLLDLLHVDLGKDTASAALERYLSTLGRETLGKALTLVELSAQTILEGDPALQKIDVAMTSILNLLEGKLGEHARQQDMEAGHVLTPEAEPNPNGKLPGTVSTGQGPALVPNPGETIPQPQPTVSVSTGPAFPPRGSPVNAYLNAPKAIQVNELLKNLPPMPKLVRIGDAIPQEPPVAGAGGSASGQTGQTGQTGTGQPATGGGEVRPQVQPPLAETLEFPEKGPESAVLRKLDMLFQTPGLNGPGIDLLKPSGFMERFLMGAGREQQSPEQVKAEADALFRQLTSENSERVEKALKELPKKDPEVLRETAQRLSERENEMLRNHAALAKLSDAASGLRDLGRQLLAAKAENLAAQDRDPGVMLAEVPLKFNDDTGDGRMQMFYRRSKKKGDGWSSRVILDLNTTRMGAVLGDMRFFGQDMILNMFVSEKETAEYLEGEAELLVDALWEKGFRVKSRFMVLPPVAAPEIRAERPSGLDADGRLDIKG